MNVETQQRRAPRRAMSIDEFCNQYGPGRTKCYEEISAGRLKAHKIGKRTVIIEDDAEDWLAKLPSLPHAGGGGAP
jgi:excisionase family DNA binding protein